jgi:DNA-binding FrmR family transcriptional regulator
MGLINVVSEQTGLDLEFRFCPTDAILSTFFVFAMRIWDGKAFHAVSLAFGGEQGSMRMRNARRTIGIVLMNIGAVLVKTRKGQEEIDTRVHKLQGRLRAVLFMIDGQRTGAELLDQAGELAEQLSGQLDQLIAQGFVEEVAEGEESVLAPEEIAPPQAVPRAAPPQPATKPASPASMPRTAPTWTTVPLDVLKARLGKMLNDSFGMRAMFMTAQLNAVSNHRDLEKAIDEMAQSLATSVGADSARKWRGDARNALGMPA